jgi:hypothetical protein
VSITFDADDPRTIKALELAAEADRWLSGRNAAGDQIFGVPSQREAGRYYIVTQSNCDCPDFAQHADAAEPHACKHVLAVRLHCELVRAQQQRARRTTEPRPPERRTAHLQLLPSTPVRE